MIDTFSSCCFIGHRKIDDVEKSKEKLQTVIEYLITDKNIRTFNFGSKSRFNDLCYSVVTELKLKYPDIKRVYIRAEFPFITPDYEKYLLKSYEETFYPMNIVCAGKGVYIKRNRVMINKSDFCIFYYNKDYLPLGKKQSQSGTKLAYEYALKNKKPIINIF